MKARTALLVWLVAVGCDGAGSSTGAQGPTGLTPTGSSPAPSACVAPLVRLQTGQDPTCSGGNEHLWPIGLDASDCHGWTAEDNQGSVHENSAAAIGCNPDGSFSFTQYAGNLDCSGSGVTKTYFADQCEQDIPPTLYTVAVDLSCCTAPDGPDCTSGVPSVSTPGGVVFLNGAPCEP